MAAHARYSRKRHKAAVEAFRKRGYYNDAAQAADVDRHTLWEWRKRYPELQADMDVAREQQVERIGRKYIRAIELHVDAVLTGQRLPDRLGVHPQTGRLVVLQQGDLVRLCDKLTKLALTRYEPAWTKDTAEITVSQFEEAMDAVQREEEEGSA